MASLGTSFLPVYNDYSLPASSTPSSALRVPTIHPRDENIPFTPFPPHICQTCATSSTSFKHIDCGSGISSPAGRFSERRLTKRSSGPFVFRPAAQKLQTPDQHKQNLLYYRDNEQSRAGSINNHSPYEIELLSPMQYRRPQRVAKRVPPSELLSIESKRRTKGKGLTDLAAVRFLNACFSHVAPVVLLPDDVYTRESVNAIGSVHKARRSNTVVTSRSDPLSRSIAAYDGPSSDEIGTSSPLGQPEHRSSPSRRDYPRHIASPPDDRIDRVDWAHQCLIRKALESLKDAKPEPNDRCHPSNFDGIEGVPVERPEESAPRMSTRPQSRRMMNRTAMASCPELHNSGERYLSSDVIVEEGRDQQLLDEEVERKRAVKKSKQRATSYGQADTPVGFRESIAQRFRTIGLKLRRPSQHHKTGMTVPSPADIRHRRLQARDGSSDSDGIQSTPTPSPGHSPGMGSAGSLPYSTDSASRSPAASALAVAGMMAITGELDRLSNIANRSAENIATFFPHTESPAVPDGPHAPPNTPASPVNGRSGAATPHDCDSSQGSSVIPTARPSPVGSRAVTPTATQPIPIPGSPSPMPNRRRLTRSRMSEMFSADEPMDSFTKYTTVFDDHSQISLDITRVDQALEKHRPSPTERRRSSTLATIILDDQGSRSQSSASEPEARASTEGSMRMNDSIDDEPSCSWDGRCQLQPSLTDDTQVGELDTAGRDSNAHDAVLKETNGPGKLSGSPRHGIAGVLSSWTSGLRRRTSDGQKPKSLSPQTQATPINESMKASRKHKVENWGSTRSHGASTKDLTQDAPIGIIQTSKTTSTTPGISRGHGLRCDDISPTTEPVDRSETREQPVEVESDHDSRVLRRNTTGTVHILAMRKKSLHGDYSSGDEEDAVSIEANERDATEIDRHGKWSG